MQKILICICLIAFAVSGAADDSDSLIDYIDRQGDKYDALAMDLWDYAELGYLETKSSERLQKTLAAEGFEIQSGVANIPTAFVASYGEGEPVIAILAEFILYRFCLDNVL